MSFTISHGQLWKAKWDGLCRLGRAVGLRVGNGKEGKRRGPLVEAIHRRIVELELEDASRHLDR